jgi:hypothetical protein
MAYGICFHTVRMEVSSLKSKGCWSRCSEYAQCMLIWVKVMSLHENYINYYMHNMLRLTIFYYHEYYLKSN